MPIRIPTQTVIVHRNGSNYAPPIGSPFNFTAEEVDEINQLAPDALRKPVNEEAAAAAPAQPKQAAQAKQAATAEPVAAATTGKGKQAAGGKQASDDTL